ncbi:uracil permease [Oceanospirillum multiglobuliferum]|uniref:Uracil permease n=3 Tax=Oceanospirillum TaxID=965 RepID=A0A1T4PY19_9GAMM|nr:uracil-xanthine permease family protein [Oceanospirillum multiglobuliferum]OPX55428.1 uracil permease [Oceanospirillum multiglobuliferum]SJZ96412.1 uracil permease [Oceanospirillum multiglobuliferum]
MSHDQLSAQRADAFSVKTVLTGAQMLFVAFGALVLVPLLTGLDANVALFTAGAGTLLFQLVTRGQVPVFLASSFAFIAPIIASVQSWGIPATMGGLFAAGLAYVLLSALVKAKGADILHRILPPVVVGPVIMVIGLALAPVAVNMAMGKTGDGSGVLVAYDKAIIVSMFALLVTLLMAVFSKGIFRLIPILSGVVAGYGLAFVMGLVDLSPVTQAAWISMPAFTAPEFHWQAILFMIPVAIAPAIEHLGDMVAISQVTGKNYLKKPGLHRTLLGDGLATSTAALFGGPPNTTYSEVTGAVMLTRNFNPVIMTWAAIFAILLAFIGKMGAVLQTIPVPVMGGIMTLLFGSIAVVGMNTLVKSGQDLTAPRNLSIIALILVFGIGGMYIGGGEFSLQGVSLCAIVGVLLNLILPKQAE